MESPFQSSRSEASGDLPDLADLPGGLEHFEAFYREQKLCKDWDLCWQRMRLPLPPCLRLEAEALKLLAPWQPELVPWCGAFRLHAHAVDELGHYHPELAKVLSDGQRAGKIIRQESASMLPALALGIQPEHKIVELCAAPGSKTLQILDIMQASAGSQVPSGLLVANDSKGGRLRKLIDRVRRVPASPLLVTRADARRFPQLRQHADGCPVLFDRVLCDVPCSGDGTMRKARSLLRRWTPRAGVGHHGIQLEILLQGLKLLAPKGLLAYSTCALNPVECEAVVSAALCQQPGFETVPIQVPGLQLEPGLPTWRVPALTRAATWATWHEVPEDEKASGQLRRSMFPPAAYAATAMVAGLEQQLLRCGRLLPSNDDGGCFFLALVRRKEEGTAAFSKGDRVLATAVGQQGVVRGPGTKQFRGLLRVLYDDGSQYHVAPNELLKLSPETAVEQAKPASLRPLLCAVPDDWHRIAGFFGVDLLASCLAQGSGGAICLASPSLKVREGILGSRPSSFLQSIQRGGRTRGQRLAAYSRGSRAVGWDLRPLPETSHGPVSGVPQQRRGGCRSSWRFSVAGWICTGIAAARNGSRVTSRRLTSCISCWASPQWPHQALCQGWGSSKLLAGTALAKAYLIDLDHPVPWPLPWGNLRLAT
ncbi:unnamed protein product [Effrenium voratum]|nr:unnamed protein product [Effrenium voratum]